MNARAGAVVAGALQGALLIIGGLTRVVLPQDTSRALVMRPRRPLADRGG